ncbi:UNVERIFIED_CONTAM: hypothetical protein Sradi_2334000 [Sesamum radiatum]|uniref:Myb/SANT-like domain-containing protein n=1 Tax=Sesamum radiatum TaxID=300843 RepID=A0AAW2T6E7_SESRA
MEDDGNKGVRRQGVKRDEKLSRRVWSTAEEEALLECLREIVRTGWKSNGFRIGYLGVLEQLLNKACPNSGLKADPHISSKIHVWKKTYGCINDMMGRSGFGWNENTNSIEAKNEVFENFAKNNRDHYSRLIHLEKHCGTNHSLIMHSNLPCRGGEGTGFGEYCAVASVISVCAGEGLALVMFTEHLGFFRIEGGSMLEEGDRRGER